MHTQRLFRKIGFYDVLFVRLLLLQISQQIATALLKHIRSLKARDGVLNEVRIVGGIEEYDVEGALDPIIAQIEAAAAAKDAQTADEASDSAES